MKGKSRKKRLEEIDALLEMVEPEGDYKGGSIHYNDVKWLRDEVTRLEKQNKRLRKKVEELTPCECGCGQPCCPICN